MALESKDLDLSSDEEYSEFSAKPVAKKSEIKAACAPKSDATKGFAIQQTMLRIKNPVKSLKFYTGVLGMSLIDKMEFPTFMYSSFFVGYDDGLEKPKTREERLLRCYSNKSVIELQCGFKYDSECDSGDDSDEQYMRQKYTKPGFGFIGIAVPDINVACEHFEKAGAHFDKKLKEGNIQCNVYLKDPDGYGIKIYQPDMQNEMAFFKRKRRYSEIDAHNKGEEYKEWIQEEENDEGEEENANENSKE